MNILLLDNDESLKELLNHYITMEQDWNLFHNKLFDDTSFTIDDIDVIIVDYLKEKYRQTIEAIISTNSKIKTIIISDILEASCAMGCEYCENNYKRKRLLKPIEPKVLYELIKNFDIKKCDYYKSFENIKNILPNILQRFLYLEYDKMSHQVISKVQNQTSRYTFELVSFINILEKNNINYSIIDEYTIQLY